LNLRGSSLNVIFGVVHLIVVLNLLLLLLLVLVLLVVDLPLEVS
jgi:hypothetical protein